jgi:hypothetical protein
MIRRGSLLSLAVLSLLLLLVHCSGHGGSSGETADGGTQAGSEAGSGSDAAPDSTTEGGVVDGSRLDTGTTPGDAALQTSNCFASPGACGFPDPAYGNVGPSAPCSSLSQSGSITVSQAGAMVQNLNVAGSITVNAANVTIQNVCVTYDGDGNYNNGPAVAFNAPGGLIEYSTVHGDNATTESMQAAIAGSGTIDHVYAYDCGECIHDGPWTVSDSYIESNGADFGNGYSGDAGQGPEDHHEDVYLATSTFVGNHDTILNPFGETATVFGDTYNNGGVCGNHITITNSLLAGGGYVVYTCGSQTSAGASTMNVSNNRFARCLTTPVFDMASGGTACAGGQDSHGYWPNGGYFGIDAYTNCPPTSGQAWSDNVWDDDGGTVGCQ